MRLPFNEAKATQAAACLLKIAGGKMNYMKLIKLLYLIDREALLRRARPVTTDRYVSTDNGLVLSQTLDLINEGKQPEVRSTWSECIAGPVAHLVTLRKDPPPNGELSPAEERLIKEILRQHGRKSRRELAELMRKLPEWRDPHGSAIPVSYADILKAAGRDPNEAAQIEAEIVSVAITHALLRAA